MRIEKIATREYRFDIVLDEKELNTLAAEINSLISENNTGRYPTIYLEVLPEIYNALMEMD